MEQNNKNTGRRVGNKNEVRKILESVGIYFFSTSSATVLSMRSFISCSFLQKKCKFGIHFWNQKLTLSPLVSMRRFQPCQDYNSWFLGGRSRRRWRWWDPNWLRSYGLLARRSFWDHSGIKFYFWIKSIKTHKHGSSNIGEPSDDRTGSCRRGTNIGRHQFRSTQITWFPTDWSEDEWSQVDGSVVPLTLISGIPEGNDASEEEDGERLTREENETAAHPWKVSIGETHDLENW